MYVLFYFSFCAYPLLALARQTVRPRKLNTRVRTFPLWQNLALFAHAFPARRDSRLGKDSDVTVWSGVVGNGERVLVRGEADRASRDEGVRDFK